MMPFPTCPICGGEMIHKTVEEILQGGGNTAIVTVEAELCLHCGERLFTPETIAYFEMISARLEKEQTQGFQKIGAAYAVPVT